MEVLAKLRRPATIGPEDLPLFAGVVVASGIYRLVLSRAILRRLASFFKVKFPDKFVHRAFDLIHYTISGLLGSLALWDRPHMHCVFWGRDCQRPLAPTIGACHCTAFEKIYYMTFCAYYIVDGMFVWTVPNDMIAIACHHIVTVAMIIFSVLVRIPVVGVTLMLLHDCVDIPLYAGKVFGYLGLETAKEVALLFFGASYLWLRMINLPLVITLTWMNIPKVCFRFTLYVITVSLEWVLMICHCWWFWKIIKGVRNWLTKGRVQIRDNRSD
jgi:hypothetical protein